MTDEDKPFVRDPNYKSPLAPAEQWRDPGVIHDTVNPQMDIYKTLKEANDALHVIHECVLVDGPVAGKRIELPDGVMNLTVTVDGKDYTYLRGAREEYTFLVHPKGA